MYEFLSVFTTTLGGTIGVLCAAGILLSGWFIFKIIIKRHRNLRKMPKLILKYRKVLIALEKFEELIIIDHYLERLKRNEMPRELSIIYSAKYLKDFLKKHTEA